MSKVTNFFKPFLKLFEAQQLTEQITKKELDYTAGIESKETNPDRLLNETGRDVTLYDLMLMDDRIKFSINLSLSQ